MPDRTADHIIADAAITAAAAQTQETTASAAQVRLAEAPEAIAAAQTAREQANQAREVAARGDIHAAENLLRAAKASLAEAVAKSAPGAIAAGFGDPKDEWKECRSTIDRFDKLLVDLRKTGFGVVTALVGAATYVFTQSISAATKVGILCMLILLIVTLYLIDRVHQVWLMETVRLACELEARLDFKLTRRLGSEFRGGDATILGLLLYVMLLSATVAIFWIAIPLQSEHLTGGHRMTMLGAFAVGLLAMLAALKWNQTSELVRWCKSWVCARPVLSILSAAAVLAVAFWLVNR